MTSTASPVAVVTGASRGIGASTAIMFAERDFDVVLVARDTVALDEVAAQVKAAGQQSLVVPGDVSESGFATSVIERTVERFGRVDVLVNNAGVSHQQLFGDIEESDIDLVFNTNIRAPVLLSQAATAQFRQQGTGGRIVNIISTFAFSARPGFGLYSTSKAALIGLTRALAVELARDNVTVNGVAPGHTDTAMTAEAPPGSKLYARLMMDIPHRRFGRPQEIADCILFFAVDAPDYVTGEVLRVDGGYLAW